MRYIYPNECKKTHRSGLPLTGEWCAVNTPGYKLPSHGTDQLGHTGNSTTPHLHFRRMDRPELLQAQGLPLKLTHEVS